MDATLGRVVYSKTGRDRGHVFVIIRVLDNDFVMVADGKLRTVAKPKKKRNKHLKYTEYVLEDIKRLLETGRKILDSDIRKALEGFSTEVL